MGPMNRAPSEAQDYLEAFRRERPGTGARERNWQELEHRLAGRVPREREPATPRTTDVRVVVLAVGMTLALAAAVLLVIGGIGRGLQAARQHAEPAMQAVDEPVTAPPLPVVPRRPAPAASTPVEPDPSVTPATPAPSRPKAQPLEEPPTTREPALAPAPSPEALAEQTRLLGRARRALADHDPREALRLLEQLRERFPAGALEHERQAYDAIARCRLDPPSADAAARFLADQPASPHAPRVRAACDAVATAPLPRE